MNSVGEKFKSVSGVNVTLYKKYNSWGSFIALLRKVDSRGKVIREGIKLVSAEDIKTKMIDFEEDYIKKYTNLMKAEFKSKV